MKFISLYSILFGCKHTLKPNWPPNWLNTFVPDFYPFRQKKTSTIDNLMKNGVISSKSQGSYKARICSVSFWKVSFRKKKSFGLGLHLPPLSQKSCSGNYYLENWVRIISVFDFAGPSLLPPLTAVDTVLNSFALCILVWKEMTHSKLNHPVYTIVPWEPHWTGKWQKSAKKIKPTHDIQDSIRSQPEATQKVWMPCGLKSVGCCRVWSETFIFPVVIHTEESENG